MIISNWVKSNLSWKQRRFLRNLVDDLKASFHRKDLMKLGFIYRTDKAGVHKFGKLYTSHFWLFRSKRIRLLEIGVGGYDSPLHGGESLRMWKKFFPKGKISSIDFFDKSALQEHRIQIFKGNQADNEFLDYVNVEGGPFDIIVDDGSHINIHVIETFKFMFNKLNDGGIYVIEDTQTSYWEDFGGDSSDLDNPKTTVNFLKSLVNGLNHQEYIRPGYQPSYFDINISSIHFYHNIIFVYKGKNNQPSSLVIDNSYRIR